MRTPQYFKGVFYADEYYGGIPVSYTHLEGAETLQEKISKGIRDIFRAKRTSFDEFEEEEEEENSEEEQKEMLKTPSSEEEYDKVPEPVSYTHLYLMAVFVCKAHNFIFNGRAVSGTCALDCSGI